jgi:hypothetical protein
MKMSFAEPVVGKQRSLKQRVGQNKLNNMDQLAWLNTTVATAAPGRAGSALRSDAASNICRVGGADGATAIKARPASVTDLQVPQRERVEAVHVDDHVAGARVQLMSGGGTALHLRVADRSAYSIFTAMQRCTLFRTARRELTGIFMYGTVLSAILHGCMTAVRQHCPGCTALLFAHVTYNTLRATSCVST